ncbi:hypothetical protein PRUPE_3G130600 [Prunus persica]|uniref:Uncharacterized protein n=1 Tax=Prunus persica TaxID=3760 RepID=A0A251PZC5_PRUPE|nr:hypothetical protein PRUPE_3G130600 [Prunus persica]
MGGSPVCPLFQPSQYEGPAVVAAHVTPARPIIVAHVACPMPQHHPARGPISSWPAYFSSSTRPSASFPNVSPPCAPSLAPPFEPISRQPRALARRLLLLA